MTNVNILYQCGKCCKAYENKSEAEQCCSLTITIEEEILRHPKRFERLCMADAGKMVWSLFDEDNINIRIICSNWNTGCFDNKLFCISTQWEKDGNWYNEIIRRKQ